MAVSLSSFGGLNGYWGQYGSEPLRNYCDSGVDFVTLSFVNVAPENDLSGYPGTNFAGHCSAGTYSNKDGVPSQLLSNCDIIKQDIPYCQDRGVKVLLSIGGVYNPVGSDYKVSEGNGEGFADFLYKAFGPYDPSWDGPRPFDLSETQHSAVDGFDFDLEAALENGPYIDMIDEFRSLDSSLIITGAPQCPTNDPYFYMKDLINKASFDALFIQFYNNPGCDAIDDPNVSWDNFNYDDWEDIIASSENSKNAKLYVGLPSATDAAGSGYISPEDLKGLVCDLKDKAHFGGISLWDLTRGAANVIDGKSYNEHALDALKYGCDPIPTSTATSTVVSTTATSASESTTATSASESTTAVSTTTAESTTDSATTTAETTSDVISTTATETTAETTGSTSASSDITSDSSTAAETSTSAGNSTTVASTSADSTTAISTTETDLTTSATIPSSTHTFSTFSWSNTTVTSATISETSTGSGSETTNTGSASLTSGSGSETTNSGSASQTSGLTSGAVTATTATTESVSMTTSVVYTTEVHTVTKCPPYVHNCPEGGYVTTKTIALYTTVCPVSGGHSKPTISKPVVSKPTITKAPSYETKTVYATNVHTITSCPPEVHNCPVGSVTTEVSSWYTTVVHVTETLTAEAHKPTDESPAPPAYTGGHNGGEGGYEGCGENCGEVPEEKTTTDHATSTIYRTVIVPPATLETSTKPAVFTPQPKPHHSGKEQPSGVAIPTGGCTGEGCPEPTSVPSGVPTVPTAPVTAGASTLAVGLTGLAAMMLFAL